MKQIIKNTLSILTTFERRRFNFIVLLNILVSIADIAAIALLVFIVGVYTQSNSQVLFDGKYPWLTDKDSLLPIGLFMVLFFIKSVVGYRVFTMQYNFVYKVSSRISETNLQHYLEGNFDSHVHVDSSVHIRRIMQQPVEFAHYVLSGIQLLFTEGALSLLTLVVVLVFKAKMFLLLSVVLLPPIALIAMYTKRRLKNARAHVKATNETALQYLNEALSGYIESNIYDKSDFFRSRYASYQQQLARYLADVQTTSGITSRFMELFAVMGLFALVVINKYWGNQGALEIVNIGAFMAAAYKIIPGLVKISNTVGQVKTYEYTINDLLTVKNSSAPVTQKKEASIRSVVFSKVNYSHKGHLVLNGFDFEIAPGDFIGVTGASGRGKTTFINLLLGFLKEEKGSIAINGEAMIADKRKAFWPRIAYAQQRQFLIHNTIAANIALSEDHYNKQKLDEVIAATVLNSFVAQQPEGLKKLVTENGKNLSGGQRQRIAIARALYKDADLIILDEPFSELDAQSEQHILQHLQGLAAAGKMIVMITHKKGNLVYCNKTCHLQ